MAAHGTSRDLIRYLETLKEVGVLPLASSTALPASTFNEGHRPNTQVGDLEGFKQSVSNAIESHCNTSIPDEDVRKYVLGCSGSIVEAVTDLLQQIDLRDLVGNSEHCRGQDQLIKALREVVLVELESKPSPPNFQLAIQFQAGRIATVINTGLDDGLI